MAKEDKKEKGAIQSFLISIGFGTPQQRAFDDLIAKKNFKKARESFPELYKEYIQDKRKKPKRKSKGGYTPKKRTGSIDYRKGGMVLSTVDNRKK
mgnify:CR=1 FL=1